MLDLSSVVERVTPNPLTLEICLRDGYYTPGEQLKGEIHLTGATQTQAIAQIEIFLVTEYLRDIKGTSVTEECILAHDYLFNAATLNPQESKIVPFSLTLPEDTPLTLLSQAVYLKTAIRDENKLLQEAVLPLDVKPTTLMQEVLNTLKALEFDVYQADCEYNPHLGRPQPFTQSLRLKRSDNNKSVSDIVVMFFLGEGELEVLLEIPCKIPGLTVDDPKILTEAGYHRRFAVEDADCQGDRLLHKITELLNPLQ